MYPPKKATNIKLCSKIRKQTADNESPVSQKHPKRTTVMRREGKKALGKTRGTSNERKGRGEKLSSPSQNAGDLERSTVVERG